MRVAGISTAWICQRQRIRKAGRPRCEMRVRAGLQHHGAPGAHLTGGTKAARAAADDRGTEVGWLRQLRAQPVLFSAAMTAPHGPRRALSPAPAGEAGAPETDPRPPAVPGASAPAAGHAPASRAPLRPPPGTPPAPSVPSDGPSRPSTRRPGTPWPQPARGPRPSPAGGSTAPGGTPTARTPTSRRWSSWTRRRPTPGAPVAIVPLMHRHEVEPDDAILRTRLRGVPQHARRRPSPRRRRRSSSGPATTPTTRRSSPGRTTSRP